MFHKSLKQFRMDNKLTLREFCLQTGLDACRVSELERQVTEEPPTQTELDLMEKVGFEGKNVPYELNPEKIAREKQFKTDLKALSKEDFLFKYGIVFACNTEEKS